MSNQTYLNFEVQFQADGTSTTYSFDAKNGPVGLQSIGSGLVLNPAFKRAPVGATGFGGTIASAVGTPTLDSITSEGVVTVTLPSAPSAGQYSLTGMFLYD